MVTMRLPGQNPASFAANFLVITTVTVTPGNPRSRLGMAMWPLPTFTSGIYPRRQPQEQTALGCTIPRFSQFPDWHSEWCSELVNPPAVWPYGLEAFREGIRHSR
jgi:hypothetical protein